VHRAEQIAGRVDGVPLMSLVSSSRLGSRVDDNGGACEYAVRQALTEVRRHPLMYVRVIDVCGPADAAHAEATSREMASYLPSKEPSRTGKDRDRRVGGDERFVTRSPGQARSASHFASDLLVQRSDAAEMLG